jgi:hypothetical protein
MLEALQVAKQFWSACLLLVSTGGAQHYPRDQIMVPLIHSKTCRLSCFELKLVHIPFSGNK